MLEPGCSRHPLTKSLGCREHGYYFRVGRARLSLCVCVPLCVCVGRCVRLCISLSLSLSLPLSFCLSLRWFLLPMRVLVLS